MVFKTGITRILCEPAVFSWLSRCGCSRNDDDSRLSYGRHEHWSRSFVETGDALPSGAVGVIFRAPADETHSYRIRFVDGSEASLKRDEFRILHAVRESGVGEGAEID